MVLWHDKASDVNDVIYFITLMNVERKTTKMQENTETFFSKVLAPIRQVFFSVFESWKVLQKMSPKIQQALFLLGQAHMYAKIIIITNIGNWQNQDFAFFGRSYRAEMRLVKSEFVGFQLGNAIQDIMTIQTRWLQRYNLTVWNKLRFLSTRSIKYFTISYYPFIRFQTSIQWAWRGLKA